MLQRVSSGPDTSQQWVKLSYMKMISMAKESCYIQTPYFMPDASMMDALRVAAASGVDVRLMIPCKPDHWFLFWASQSFCADLLKSGVRSFKYDKGFLHAKTVVVDGKVGSVGSANVDPRSFHLNFETNVIIFDESLGAQMRDAFLEDQKVCTELTPELYAKRGLVVRFKEPFCRLLYPVQ
jgi:cardiolipin synthase